MTLTILNEWKHRNADDRLVGKSVRLDDAFSRAMLSHFAQSEPRAALSSSSSLSESLSEFTKAEPFSTEYREAKYSKHHNN